MKKLMMAAIAATALAATGCKGVWIKNDGDKGWSATYISLFQENDVKGLKVKAGDDAEFEVEQTKSSIDPAAADALSTAADALSKAASACSGGACGE